VGSSQRPRDFSRPPNGALFPGCPGVQAGRWQDHLCASVVMAFTCASSRSLSGKIPRAGARRAYVERSPHHARDSLPPMGSNFRSRRGKSHIRACGAHQSWQLGHWRLTSRSSGHKPATRVAPLTKNACTGGCACPVTSSTYPEVEALSNRSSGWMRRAPLGPGGVEPKLRDASRTARG